ncbi:WecB/TagA/CpsF family glycosyltransferase [Candidatus Sumerlaeota bacterium]|nr:WecB/TagA/CpsF family glycosyltransferase [Candidatus Sumerlaeota bacterium]
MTDSTSTFPRPVTFLGSRLHPVTTRQFIELTVETAVSKSGPIRITYLNAHCSNLAEDNARYQGILNRCDLVYADGQAVVWAARYLGAAVPERVNAGDFILDFCRACAGKGASLYLIGSAEGVAERAAEDWRHRVPGLEISGTHAGYFGGEDEAVIAEKIRSARPSILLVGMGSPRQEEWTMAWAERLQVPVVWCVGALFEYYSGKRARAPVWMRRAGLEWLFRLVLEPRRLWKRYLWGNLRFVRRVLRAKRTSAR